MQIVHFFILHIVRIRELAKEALDFVLEDGRTFFNDVLNVLEYNVLSLNGSEGNNRNNGRCKLLD